MLQYLYVEAYILLQKETYTVSGANRVGNSESKIKTKTLQLILYFTNNQLLQIHQTWYSFRLKLGSTTFRRGRLGAGRLGAAD